MKKMSCLTWFTPIFILLIGLHLTSVRSVSVYDEPPSIVAHPTTRYGDKRLPLVLKCRATGTPEPTYYWKKNGVLIDVNTNDRASLVGGNLVIDPMQDEDNGVYQCFASNRLGTAMSKKITTAVAYVDEFVDIMPSTFTVRVGEPMSLRCGIEHGPPGGYPDPLFYWTDDSPKPSPIVYDPRINKDQEGTLVFSNVIASDAKSYYCQAINTVVGVSRRSPKITLIVQTGFGSPDESLAKLVAHPPPNAVALRTEDYSMKCIATGYPTPEITWKRGEEQLQSGGRVSIDETGQRLVISAVEYFDRGTYTCMASNNGGTDEFSSVLTVQSAPYFPAPPSDETKLLGESVSTECRADGVPPPIVDVLVNGEPWAEFLSSMDTRWTVVTGNKKVATISIVDLQTTDSNVFQCIATNKFREELTTVVLSVLAIPARITSLAPQAMTVFKNSSATFICHVEGKPIPVITWTFKGSVLTDGNKYSVDEEEGRLVITSVKGADSGVYECRASNDIYGQEYSERDEAYLTVLENFTVRLAGTERSANEGRVEISYDGIWGTVCSNGWDLVDANVVCKEMGFIGAMEVGNATTYGEGSGPIWMDNVNCSGTEVTLNDCRHSGPRTSGCNHSNDAGVVCSTPATPPTTATTPAHDSLGAGGIAGIAVCFGILVVIAILFVVVRCKQRQTKRRTMKEKTEPRPTAL